MNKPIPLSRRRLVDVVIDHLRTEIQEGALPAGSRLPPEAQLTVELGVSRTTLREAVVVLSHDGLLDVRQGDGTYVTRRAPARETFEQRLDQAGGEDVLALRRVLEPMAARLAAERRSDDAVRRMRLALGERYRHRMWAEMSRVADYEMEVREEVAKCSGNAVLADLVQRLIRHRSTAAARPGLADVDVYEALFSAILHRDGDAAANAAERIVDLETPSGSSGDADQATIDSSVTEAANRRGPRVKRPSAIGD